jgi:hypothetical protein
MKKFILFFAVLLITEANLYAWIYPEHRDIALLAIENLSPEYRSELDKLWAEARKGYEERLTESVIDATQTVNITQLDYASWSAIAGDHSCSPENLLYNVLQTEWILEVANVAADLKINLAKAKDRSAKINALRDSDIQFQRVDPEYATRAGSNNVHFLLARPDVYSDARTYLTACLEVGIQLNALGAYSWFHDSALMKAARYADENLTDEEKSALILSALADEAFALHFLEDAFAAGHIAGTWGSASQRKGTHDYYNEFGLEVVTWDGRRMIVTGDAYMRDQDAEVAAAVVQLSIEQFLDAAFGEIKLNYIVDSLTIQNLPDSFNVCKNNYNLSREYDPDVIPLLADVLVQTPAPGLASGLGELPRFKTELGLFIGVATDLRTNGVSGGFGVDQTTAGAVGGLDLNVRFGLGIEGVLNEAGDGLVFIEVGWRQDSPSSMSFGDVPPQIETGQIASAIPGRDAFNFGIRMPFYIIPFDLLITAPILLWAAPEAYASMAVTAGNGGLIPWQAGIATSFGRFQFILGREVSASLYGSGEDQDAIIVQENNTSSLLTYKSVQLDFPVVEYRPFRTFSLDQSSSLRFIFSFGVDFPYDAQLVLPEGGNLPELKPVWNIGLTAEFDWRYYF